jgi:hypothetical protein
MAILNDISNWKTSSATLNPFGSTKKSIHSFHDWGLTLVGLGLNDQSKRGAKVVDQEDWPHAEFDSHVDTNNGQQYE